MPASAGSVPRWNTELIIARFSWPPADRVPSRLALLNPERLFTRAARRRRGQAARSASVSCMGRSVTVDVGADYRRRA